MRGLSEKLDRRACPTTIGRLLRDQKIGLRSHRKVLHTGKKHQERDKQFRYIAEKREDFRASGDPRISVDTKKKELIGQFKNAGQTWRREGEKVNDHDFRSDAEAIAVPYGIYDPERNTGHVCVSTSKDVPDFAADALENWWQHNRQHYPNATRLMIEADSGGSNSARSRQYKKPVVAVVEGVVGDAATAPGRDNTRSGSRGSRIRPDWKSRCATIRRGPRNGTRWSTGSSARSQRPGRVSC